MNESDLLWVACLAAPADDTARQVFADKLQEAGFERMADLMRGSNARRSEDAVYIGDAMSGEADALIDATGEVTREVTRAEISDYSGVLDEDEAEEDA
jgi:uncharacterized protein (TIGR02996 family)